MYCVHVCTYSASMCCLGLEVIHVHGRHLYVLRNNVWYSMTSVCINGDGDLSIIINIELL